MIKLLPAPEKKESLQKIWLLAFEKEYLQSMKLLGINSVSKYARATDYIKEIISQVKRLAKKGYAYKIEETEFIMIFQNLKIMANFAGRTVLQAEDAVSRIDYSKDKKNRGDFCLWKFQTGRI